MAKYSASVNGTALSTTTGLLTVVTTATGAGSIVYLNEIMLGGEAGSSTVARVAVNRFAAAASGAGADPTGAATAQTCEKLNPGSAAFAGTVATAFASTQGTLSTNDVLILGFNAFGGVIRWLAAPGEEIVVGGQGAVQYLGIRSRSGTPFVSGHIVLEQA